ncbi:hornerin isoform X1 [Tetranychus urticae]|uniref:hornerin isoform X1 n=1 Tax=Tetranychus urticae TaxID=32264 RepID=UPI00077C037C|nr:hornerin isoform X1 [Tetranychus urticae]
MTTIRILLVISMLATVAPAAVKRDEFGGASPSAEHPNTSSGQNYQSGTSGSSPQNMYYYYYPVQDKGKEHGYQASSSNQFTSSVTPGNGNSGSSESGSPHTSALETPTSGQDLSYSAQDLSYSAQNLGQAGNLGQTGSAGDYSNQAGSSNYDQLSNIASQLQQYGFGSSSPGNSAFAPGSPGYSPSGSSYHTGNSYTLNSDGSGSGYSTSSSSGPSASSFPGTGSDASGPYSQSGPVPGFTGPAASGAPGGYGGQPGSIPYGSQPGYGYQSHGGYDAYPAASNQHAAYEPPASGYRRYGIGSAILPILALAGLSLLIPTVTSLSTAATGRKRRSIDTPAKDTGLGSYFERLDRYYTLYKTAVEREECMNRILCELGDAMSTVRGKSTLFNVMEKVAPTWMNNKVGALKSGALSPEYGKCKKYTCQ